MDSSAQYLHLFDQHRTLLLEGRQGVPKPLRLRAYETLKAKGLPNKKTEDYRYTDIQALLAPDWGINLKRKPAEVDIKELSRGKVAGMNGLLVLMVNDEMLAVANGQLALPEGVEVKSLSQWMAADSEWISHYLGQLAEVEADGMVALNTLLAQDGLVVHVERNVKLMQPLQVVCQGISQMDLLSLRRLLVVLDDGAEVSLLMVGRDGGDRHRMVSQVGEIFLGKGARLNMWCIDQEKAETQTIDHLCFSQEEGSSLAFGNFSLQQGLLRRTLQVNQKGKAAQSQLFGGVIGHGAAHVDTHLLMNHGAEGGQSDILYKYVLDDESTGAFAGKVRVQPGAQKINSLETNANLCVSPQAHMFTQPMLEIYADDVKCNHGSTVGRMDERALFYMAQRGVPEAEGRMLLQEAFLGEVVARVEHDILRERLNYWIEETFRRKAGHCVDCEICDTKKKIEKQA